MGNNENKSGNELVLLAWVRTSIGLMIFGFIVSRLNIIIKQLSVEIDSVVKVSGSAVHPYVGIILIIAGTLMAIVSFSRYFNVQSRSGQHTSTLVLSMSVLLTFIIVAVGAVLINDLVHL